MRKDTTCLFLLAGLLSVPGVAQNKKDSTQSVSYTHLTLPTIA